MECNKILWQLPKKFLFYFIQLGGSLSRLFICNYKDYINIFPNKHSKM